jgi:hypothetical protein
MRARRLDRVGSGDAELMVRERQGASRSGGGHGRKEEALQCGKETVGACKSLPSWTNMHAGDRQGSVNPCGV